MQKQFPASLCRKRHERSDYVEHVAEVIWNANAMQRHKRAKAGGPALFHISKITL